MIIEQDDQFRVDYTASKTISKFHRSDAPVKLLMGPFGSGKSVGCVIELMMRAHAQEPFKGKRRSRWLIVRNTYRELEDTTINTFFDWVPRHTGVWRPSDMKFTFNSGDVEAEFMFRALDKSTDIGKLLSLEITGGWLNEMREIPRAVFDAIQGRFRFPKRSEGGATWHGLIGDTNPPDSDHWIYDIFEEKRPEGHLIFHQPSGLGPDAENLKHLPKKYYKRMMVGKKEEWIKVYCRGNYGFVQDGKPVYPEYNDDVHTVDASTLSVVQGTPILVGIDFGLTPAALFGQQHNGHINLLSEITTNNMGAERFGELVREHLNTTYSGMDYEAWGDPSGDNRAQTDETTPFQILRAQGVEASPTDTNDPVLRREAVASPLMKMAMDGTPVVRVSNDCKMFRKGMAGKYQYKRIMVAGDDKFRDVPDKNDYSHISEAGQYLFLGIGQGRVVVGRPASGGFRKLEYRSLGIR